MKTAKIAICRIKKADCGFSLLEVVIAVTVLLIAVIAFTQLFLFAFGGIFTQGRKSEALFEDVQSNIESLYDGQSAGSGDSLTITFVGGSPDSISVSGKTIESPYAYEDRTGVIYTFIPDN